MFLVGAFAVLFSTLFGALAIWTRLFSDAFAQIGWLDFSDMRQRRLSIAILAWAFPLVWAALFLLVKLPALMVVIGGVAGTVILLMVVYAAMHFRYRQLPEDLAQGRVYDLILWVSIASILLVAIYGLYQVMAG